MATIDDLEWQHTLRTAVARYDDLRARDVLAVSTRDLRDDQRAGGPADGRPDGRPDGPAPDADPPALTREEALELLALGEVLVRKAGYGRQLSVRSARAAGASWAQIGAALGLTKQAAWEAHNRWIDEQAEQHRALGHAGYDPDDEAAARDLAGARDDDPATAGPDSER